MDKITLPAEAEIKVELSVTSTINFTAHVARRRVTKLMLDRVGNLLYGEEPSLVVKDRILWRVPIWLSLPTTGPLGQVGALDVDVQTGQILFTPELLEEIADRGDALAERATSGAE